jgi:transposase
LQGLAPSTLVMADRAYDPNAIRQQIEDQGAVPNIPPKCTRRWKSCFSPVLYRRRNAFERMFCRLKDFRRIATRYDKLAANFLSAIYLVATISYW